MGALSEKQAVAIIHSLIKTIPYDYKIRVVELSHVVGKFMKPLVGDKPVRIEPVRVMLKCADPSDSSAVARQIYDVFESWGFRDKLVDHPDDFSVIFAISRCMPYEETLGVLVCNMDLVVDAREGADEEIASISGGLEAVDHLNTLTMP